MWNATNSNFYSQIMDSLAAFFGRKPEDTTEAELHHQLVEAKTSAEHAEQAKADGLAAAATEIEALRADTVRLTAELQAATDSLETATAALTTASETTTALQNDLSAANSAMATKMRECNTLAAEVAKLVAGALPSGATQPPDGDLHLAKSPAGGGQTVKVTAFDSMLN